MKRYILGSLFAALIAASSAFAQTTTITALPAASTPLLGPEVYPADQGAGPSTVSVTTNDIASYVQSAIAALPNSQLATMASPTVKCNASGSSAVPSDCDPLTLAQFQGYVTVVAFSCINNVTTSGPPTLCTTPSGASPSTTAGQSILLVNQTTASQNGPWIIQSGAWVRPKNFPSGDVIAALCVYTVVDVSTNSRFVLNTSSAITIDTTSQTWTSQANLYAYNASGSQATFVQAATGNTSNASTPLNLVGGGSNFAGTGNGNGSNASLIGGSGSGQAPTGQSEGGNAQVEAGSGGNGTTNTKGGSVVISGGAPGATGTNQSGGNVTITAAGGGSSAATATAGAVTITAGAGGATANAAGGAVAIKPGAGGGTGAEGQVQLEDHNAAVQVAVQSSGPLFLPTTVGALATCTSGLAGTIRAVSDASSPTYGGTLTGGSTTYALALCNGTAWVAH